MTSTNPESTAPESFFTDPPAEFVDNFLLQVQNLTPEEVSAKIAMWNELGKERPNTQHLISVISHRLAPGEDDQEARERITAGLLELVAFGDSQVLDSLFASEPEETAKRRWFHRKEREPHLRVVGIGTAATFFAFLTKRKAPGSEF